MVRNSNLLPVIRQGDILLMPAPVHAVNGQPLNGKTERCILGYGEATGHHHVLENATWIVGPGVTQDDLHAFALGQNPSVMAWVVAPEPTTLQHEEHAAIQVPAGTYRVIRQREYSPAEIRSVID